MKKKKKKKEEEEQEEKKKIPHAHFNQQKIALLPPLKFFLCACFAF